MSDKLCDELTQNFNDDSISMFSYGSDDGEPVPPDSFDLSLVQSAVKDLLGFDIKLAKLTEGGNHKIYDVTPELPQAGNHTKKPMIVRIASPAFPRDKLESEVATIRYISQHTSVPVPEIFGYHSDASTSPFVEYMIMEKIEGVTAADIWDDLPTHIRRECTVQIAQHLESLFSKRFDQAGSLYHSPSTSDFVVGPIISTPFFRALDGFVRITGTSDLGIKGNRGPFATESEYLKSFCETELLFIEHYPTIVLKDLKGDATQVAIGTEALRKAVLLCDAELMAKSGPKSNPQFSLALDDFRLSNIMIDPATGNVAGLIDFEATTIAPLRRCAMLPKFLQNVEDAEASHEGGDEEVRTELRTSFLDTMNQSETGREWVEAWSGGRAFRRFLDRLQYQVTVWCWNSMDRWVNGRLKWAREQPGEAFPDTDDDGVDYANLPGVPYVRDEEGSDGESNDEESSDGYTAEGDVEGKDGEGRISGKVRAAPDRNSLDQSRNSPFEQLSRIE